MLKLLGSALVFALLSGCATSRENAAPRGPAPMACPKAAADRAPIPLWNTPGFSAPESVVYHAPTKTYFVSNVAGTPDGKDGQGWISKVSVDGKIRRPKWLRGFNAPKGLYVTENLLNIADIDRLYVHDVHTGVRKAGFTIEGAKFLNDVTAPSVCHVATDMVTNRIHAICKGDDGRNPSATLKAVAMEGPELEHPNGILWLPGHAYRYLVATWGPGMKADFSTDRPGRILHVDLREKTVTPWIEGTLGNLDGLADDGEGGVFVSDWMAGKVFHVAKDKTCTTLLDGFKGSADLTYVAETRTLVIPVMGEDRVVAYRIPAAK